MDAVKFMRLRIDEDGERADRLVHLDDTYSGQTCASIWSDDEADCDCDAEARASRPRREVEAKRWLIEHTTGLIQIRIAECLASIYSDHPDYDPSWRPNSAPAGQ